MQRTVSDGFFGMVGDKKRRLIVVRMILSEIEAARSIDSELACPGGSWKNLTFRIENQMFTAMIVNKRPASHDLLYGMTHKLEYLHGRSGSQWVELGGVFIRTKVHAQVPYELTDPPAQGYGSIPQQRLRWAFQQVLRGTKAFFARLRIAAHEFRRGGTDGEDVDKLLSNVKFETSQDFDSQWSSFEATMSGILETVGQDGQVKADLTRQFASFKEISLFLHEKFANKTEASIGVNKHKKIARRLRAHDTPSPCTSNIKGETNWESTTLGGITAVQGESRKKNPNDDSTGGVQGVLSDVRVMGSTPVAKRHPIGNVLNLHVRDYVCWGSTPLPVYISFDLGRTCHVSAVMMSVANMLGSPKVVAVYCSLTHKDLWSLAQTFGLESPWVGMKRFSLDQPCIGRYVRITIIENFGICGVAPSIHYVAFEGKITRRKRAFDKEENEELLDEGHAAEEVTENIDQHIEAMTSHYVRLSQTLRLAGRSQNPFCFIDNADKDSSTVLVAFDEALQTFVLCELTYLDKHADAIPIRIRTRIKKSIRTCRKMLIDNPDDVDACASVAERPALKKISAHRGWMRVFEQLDEGRFTQKPTYFGDLLSDDSCFNSMLGLSQLHDKKAERLQKNAIEGAKTEAIIVARSQRPLQMRHQALNALSSLNASSRETTRKAACRTVSPVTRPSSTRGLMLLEERESERYGWRCVQNGGSGTIGGGAPANPSYRTSTPCSRGAQRYAVEEQKKKAWQPPRAWQPEGEGDRSGRNTPRLPPAPVSTPVLDKSGRNTPRLPPAPVSTPVLGRARVGKKLPSSRPSTTESTIGSPRKALVSSVFLSEAHYE